MSTQDSLDKLIQQLEAGYITREEFDVLKGELLSSKLGSNVDASTDSSSDSSTPVSSDAKPSEQTELNQVQKDPSVMGREAWLSLANERGISTEKWDAIRKSPQFNQAKKSKFQALVTRKVSHHQFSLTLFDSMSRYGLQMSSFGGLAFKGVYGVQSILALFMVRVTRTGTVSNVSDTDNVTLAGIILGLGFLIGLLSTVQKKLIQQACTQYYRQLKTPELTREDEVSVLNEIVRVYYPKLYDPEKPMYLHEQFGIKWIALVAIVCAVIVLVY